ncbi:hypothetical protein BegalDRAFT_1858 [Beggiatoa alba B18LD]|uniref:YcxB-like C-terminal domain-containing protein n=1 Tax=Beggiatoa alba B18LD TaxID=395493 RepID=I3CGI9_9GAMM|nr:YcxB family protein [Beggiatoa alba]EIJ42732.1 hypothetical protein BegalDRAFT_1858 [Beggiatoa alba B18LD]
MSYQIEVHYNRAMIRYALNRFMLQRIGVWTLLLTIAALFCMPILLIFWNNLILLMFTIGLWLGVSLWGIIYLLRLRQSELILSKMSCPVAQMTFTPQHVIVSSSLGSSELKWLAFDEILQFKQAWLLIYARSGYINIPVQAMSDELRAFILACFKQAHAQQAPLK